GRHDRRPAYLRDEHQGALGRRQHDAVPGAGRSLMKPSLQTQWSLAAHGRGRGLARFSALVCMLAGTLGAAGCVMRPPRAPADDVPPLPPVAEVPKGEAGGVFSPHVPWSL